MLVSNLVKHTTLLSLSSLDNVAEKKFLLGFIFSINGVSYLARKEYIYVKMKIHMEMGQRKQPV